MGDLIKNLGDEGGGDLLLTAVSLNKAVVEGLGFEGAEAQADVWVIGEGG